MSGRRRLLAASAAFGVVSAAAPRVWGASAEPAFGAISPARAAVLHRLPRPLTGTPVRRATAALNQPSAAVAQLHVEGGMAGQSDYDAGQAAQRSLATLRDLALAWRVTGERRFLDALARNADAWTATYRVSLNPVDEECFERVVFAADLAGDDLSPATRAGLARLFGDLAAGYLDFIAASRRRTLRATDRNNWNSHRVKIATLAAYATGDPALIDRARLAFELQVERNIAASGEVTDFGERDALHYVVYSLQPLATACAAALAHGERWIDRAPAAAAGSVRRGVDWLLPYVEGAKTHEEFVNSKVRFDAQRAAAGVAGFRGRWQRAGALDLMALAAHVDPAYRPTYERLAMETRRQASDWLRILFPPG